MFGGSTRSNHGWEDAAHILKTSSLVIWSGICEDWSLPSRPSAVCDVPDPFMTTSIWIEDILTSWEWCLPPLPDTSVSPSGVSRQNPIFENSYSVENWWLYHTEWIHIRLEGSGSIVWQFGTWGGAGAGFSYTGRSDTNKNIKDGGVPYLTAPTVYSR